MVDLTYESYSLWLVALSVLIAVLASYTSFHAAARLNTSGSKHKAVWAMIGGLCLGGGIWSMHFIAMLALDMGMTVTYDPGLLVLSIVLAVAASWLAFFILLFFKPRVQWHLLGAVFIGSGIVSMHYIGMAAMQMNAEVQYSPLLVALSVVIAYLASFTALRLLSAVPSIRRRLQQELGFIGSSLLMGAAISGMHYTGMAGASFEHGSAGTGMDGGAVQTELLSIFIGIGIMTILVITTIVAVFDRQMEFKKEQLDYIDDLYRGIIHTANDAIITSNMDMMIISWNAAAERIFGHRQADVVGEPLSVIIPSAYQRRVEYFHKTGEEVEHASLVELEGLHREGHTFPLELSFSMQGTGAQRVYTGIVRDISERARQNERIQELIYRDDLTRLPNRRMLNEHLTHILEQRSLENLAVLFVDLDRFKNVNDVYGHRIGDELLIIAAERMKKHLRETDFLARQSGDEFVIILPESTGYRAGNTAHSLVQVLNELIIIEKNELFISASIGISVFPEDGETAEDLLKHADTAMYKAKSSGANQYCFFTPDMNEEVSKKMLLESGLRKGIVSEEFLLYYQPQVDVGSGEVKGYEALVRWRHPELGMVPPGEFIPLAEETGLIIPLGRWILQEACRQMAEWKAAGSTVDRMSVNISTLQFQQPDFLKMVTCILETTGLPPEYLEIELTESIVQDPQRSVPLMEQIRAKGIRISLDDFGTGYSSLSYLKDFPLNTLKIDKTFMDNIEDGQREEAIVESIIHMAQRLGFNVIAEGIEKSSQLSLLSEKACQEYQGYYFSPPLPAEAIEVRREQRDEERTS
ncbi:bifunctional diguanylate cyclase/phosphodiesterase [Marinococcus halotolerans]|uniref:bifunctional diguanylate cyclase/phosphodiesterase n=1 Tax=Marinococcus halotolerans TaxID=301092 RepID=UPI0003B5E289|nr:bifunctional diguanylate cyclase/phosphodiesterase [Marinococcus halotolerans]